MFLQVEFAILIVTKLRGRWRTKWGVSCRWAANKDVDSLWRVFISTATLPLVRGGACQSISLALLANWHAPPRSMTLAVHV